MTYPKSYPQPDEEWIRQFILQSAKRQIFVRTFERDEPLFKCGLVRPKIGERTMAEIHFHWPLDGRTTPSLVLRVRDTSTGHIYAQSMPGDFDKLDMSTPTIEEMFLQWQQQRETLPVTPPDAQKNGGDE